jgi:hypothetical protein
MQEQGPAAEVREPLLKGEISEETFEEWNRSTGSQEEVGR